MKTFAYQAGFVKEKRLRFERPVEFAQMKTTHSLRVVVAQKEVSRFGRKHCKRILILS